MNTLRKRFKTTNLLKWLSFLWFGIALLSIFVSPLSRASSPLLNNPTYSLLPLGPLTLVLGLVLGMACAALFFLEKRGAFGR